ncbi:SE1832 family protein [Shouchella lonarensis]|uniref:Uncharacterized protein n=1 Tax=Shouchella lonarensis TaxID=1464122 RepID=A0A1G6H099_9BACI|nr:SE1832 family protein [Shouchella lonarensis]SDB87568.1 hypothetical protein SAMN05421737_102203 [Shouchella lonarensis]
MEQKLAELKSDFVRLQGDIEKIESIGGDVTQSVKQLDALEKEIAVVRAELAKARNRKD